MTDLLTITPAPSTSQALPAKLGRFNPWLMLIAPVAMALVYGSSFLDWKFHRLQVHLETIAPYLPGLALVIYAVRVIVTRSPLNLILTALTAALLLREIHWGWTHRGIYVMLAAVVGWSVLWRGRLAGPLKDRLHASWLAAMLATYALSQLVAKRVFRFLPNEGIVHSGIEEGLETAAHLLLIVSSVVGSWKRATLHGQEAQGNRQSAY